MNHGFIKVAAITPKIRVADPLYNAEQVIAAMREAAGNGSRVLVFPELVLTGLYTWRFVPAAAASGTGRGSALPGSAGLQRAECDQLHRDSLERISGCLYNVLAVVNRGNLIGLIPKKNIPNYGEFYEKRHFEPGTGCRDSVFPYRHGGGALYGSSWNRYSLHLW